VTIAGREPQGAQSVRRDGRHRNPIETEGTYALPEAQVDRFMMKVLVGYPDGGRRVRDRQPRHGGPRRQWRGFCTTEQLLALQKPGARALCRSGADTVRGQSCCGDARP